MSVLQSAMTVPILTLGTLILRCLWHLWHAPWIIIIPGYRRNSGAYIYTLLHTVYTHLPPFLLFYSYSRLFGPLFFTKGALVFRTPWGMAPEMVLIK